MDSGAGKPRRFASARAAPRQISVMPAAFMPGAISSTSALTPTRESSAAVRKYSISLEALIARRRSTRLVASTHETSGITLAKIARSRAATNPSSNPMRALRSPRSASASRSNPTEALMSYWAGRDSRTRLPIATSLLTSARATFSGSSDWRSKWPVSTHIRWDRTSSIWDCCLKASTCKSPTIAVIGPL